MFKSAILAIFTPRLLYSSRLSVALDDAAKVTESWLPLARVDSLLGIYGRLAVRDHGVSSDCDGSKLRVNTMLAEKTSYRFGRERRCGVDGPTLIRDACLGSD